MAKYRQLSTGKDSKHFDFTLNDDNFETHTQDLYLLPLSVRR